MIVNLPRIFEKIKSMYQLANELFTKFGKKSLLFEKLINMTYQSVMIFVRSIRRNSSIFTVHGNSPLIIREYTRIK